MTERPPLLMIPGPVEVSPGVLAALSVAPPSHNAPALIEAFGSALAAMRQIWSAGPAAQPFVVAGGGTLAMEMAVGNLVAPGDPVVVVNTGYFSDRLTEMLRRQGAVPLEVSAEVGDAPTEQKVREILFTHRRAGPWRALFATHVDTSTGVRIDPEPLARLAREHGMVSVFDGVCATAGERFDMAGWDADVYLTAGQKALGLPPGLAMMVVSERALAARASHRGRGPALYLDWERWRPVMLAYEERRPSYFSTPATNLILALAAGLREILDEGLAARIARHERAAAALRQAWDVLDLAPVPVRPELAANTLSALLFPAGVDGSLVARVLAHGVMVAGGLHPAIKDSYFRIGHMGYAVSRPDLLRRTVEAVAVSLRDAGRAVDPRRALAPLDALEGQQTAAPAARRRAAKSSS